MSQISQAEKEQLRNEMLEDNHIEEKAKSTHLNRMKEDQVYLMETCGICEVSLHLALVVEKLNSEGFLYTRREVLEYLMGE